MSGVAFFSGFLSPQPNVRSQSKTPRTREAAGAYLSVIVTITTTTATTAATTTIPITTAAAAAAAISMGGGRRAPECERINDVDHR